MKREKIYVRVEHDLLQKLDEILTEWRRDQHGQRVTRSDVVRRLLWDGIKRRNQ